MIAYDARPLQPKTRHWGVGVVIDAILSRLNTQFEFCGLAHKFAGYKQEGIHAWPTIKKSNAIFFEISPLLLRSYDLYWGTNHFIPAATTKPSILTVHDLLLLDYPWDQSWSQLWGRRFISALRRSKTILADSETTAHDLVAKFPSISSKTIVARLGFCQPILDLQVPNLQFSNPYLVMLGAHRPRKNMRLALDVVQSLARNGKRIQLVVTGDVHQSFQKEIEGLPEMVRAVGVLSKSELFWLMQNSIGLLFPSLYEGFGFPILEAMAVGCPVLALDTPINREIGGAAALLLPNQPEPWVKAIRRLEADAVFRSEIVCMGRENISRFSWDSTAAVYSQAIHHVLG